MKTKSIAEHEIHQSGTGEKRQRDKFAETCLRRGAGKKLRTTGA